MCDRKAKCPVYDDICEGCLVARLSAADLRRRRQAERAARRGKSDDDLSGSATAPLSIGRAVKLLEDGR